MGLQELDTTEWLRHTHIPEREQKGTGELLVDHC